MLPEGPTRWDVKSTSLKKTQEMLERLYLSTGLGTAQYPLEELDKVAAVKEVKKDKKIFLETTFASEC